MDQQGRPVAIKLSTTPTEQQHLTEFQRDLVSAASVMHPNLVSVHDLGFQDEFPYVVMELVAGRDVGKLIQTNAKLPLAERIRVMLQVGEALQTAHERGVFHLDVRPSKIMVADDGAAKLLDLGLGRLSFDESRLTDRGYLIGSPFYMSPERLMSIDTADAQCDIWSFGVAFHEWISGRHPFYDDDGDRMIANIMDNPPAELPGVTGSLHRLIRQTLEKDPASRYRNFTEVVADLKPVLRECQRQDSDAMLAQARKPTDSSEWPESRRRTAPKVTESQPEPAPVSQFFGVSEAYSEEEDRSPDPVPAAAAVETNFAPQSPVEAPPPPPVVPIPQRREETASPAFESVGAQLPVPIPRSTVRILPVDESPGFPWGKVAAFAVAAMLVAGVLFFLWGPYSSMVGKGELSAEAKAISPTVRVLKTDRDVPNPAADDDSALSQEPKPFDPKSLVAPVTVPASSLRVRSNAAVLKPPALAEIKMAGDVAAWPSVLQAPPPPSPPPAPPVAKTPSVAKAAPQTIESVQAAAVRVGGSFSQPVLIHSVPPVYPPTALQRKTQGVVRFAATISKDGSVKSLQVVSGDPLLDVAAKEAVLQWQYRPALLNGEPVEVTQAIVVKFNLSQ
jgi:TonB family protein